jgi:alpha-methylacyl-CoA racemase
MTGYGREGPLAERAGHDLTYLSIAGVQAHIGRPGQPPTPPLNLVADFGGGGMFLAFGMVCALWERERSGRGQVVDAAMIDGAATLMAPLFGAAAAGAWGPRGTNMLDSGAPWYDCYETADGEWMAVGAIEPQFYVDLLDGLGLADEIDPAAQHDQTTWPALRARLVERFSEHTRAEWDGVFRDRDACVAPVLSMTEAPHDPHNQQRGTFVEVDGVAQPAPAPRFSRSRADPPRPGHPLGSDADDILAEAGFAPTAIAALRESGALPSG